MNDMSNQPLSEQYRTHAKAWVDRDAAANLLEELKSATLSERMAQLGEMPVAHAERIVKSSAEWRDYIEKMVAARKDANLAKVRLEYIRMKHSEYQSMEATKRAEMKLT
jgi:hypothetical protein